MIGHSIRLPGPLHQVLADRLEKLVRELARTPEWGQDASAVGEIVEITVTRRPAARKGRAA